MAVATYAYHSVVHYTDPMNRRDVILNELFFVLCPAQVVLGFCIDCEPTGTGGLIEEHLLQKITCWRISACNF